jgi:hypothetical protein
MHKQVFTKVNIEVDEGIAPAVEALSLFPEVQTVESCQGDKANHHTMSAVVYFNVGSCTVTGKKQLLATSDFALGFLAPLLWDAVNDSASVTVTFSGEAYVARICMFPLSVDAIANAIRNAHRLKSESGSSRRGAS